ncbi:uncharacterized protein EKO05_0005358 [Ascochyta rabiei]|uniref:uncharacterized protein n=1 Tax=Didymella rabiei TaxID=5454 RepID=UPI00220FF7BC|nr:uncharacterized protein EKO05_0005358 [Ascochyta rabiei]UPX14887.1 hypothetical protein EKO05_0005358 [Ascochyta rabiei]
MHVLTVIGQELPYEKKLAWEDLAIGKSILTVDVQHFRYGPTLSVNCSPFEVVNSEQVRLFHKTTRGWASVDTTAFALSESVDDAILDSYIGEHVALFLHQAVADSTWLNVVLNHASNYLEDDLIQRALRLWSAHRLLMQGWQLTLPGSLGMPPVTDPSSFLFNTTPAPRVIQNQLDRRLERYCADQEAECLKALSVTMLGRYRRDWVATFISAVMVLHTRERDIFRLLYWTLDTSNVRRIYLLSRAR